MPAEHNTPQGEFSRSLEEIGELGQEIDAFDGSREGEVRIGEEAADVIIRMLGIITVVNCNAAALLTDKLDVIARKYDPERHHEFRRQGLTFHEAMALQKKLWERDPQLHTRQVPAFNSPPGPVPRP